MAFLEDVLATLERWLLSTQATEIAAVAGAAMMVYAIALWITRTGKHRFLAGNTVFDVLLGFILGSMLSRSINGGADLVSSAVAGFVLVGMHFVMSALSVRSHSFGRLVKGGFEQLVKDGVVDEGAMRRHFLTKNDLMQAARHHGVDDIAHIKSAYFERSGGITVVPVFQVRVVEIDVEEGVQKVRLEIYD